MGPLVRWFIGFALLGSSAHGWTLIGSGFQGWASRVLYVYVNTSQCPIPSEDVYRSVDEALAIWNSVPTAELVLVRAAEETTEDLEDYQNGTALQLPAFYCDDAFETNFGDSDVVPALTLVNPTGAVLDRAVVVVNGYPLAPAALDNLSEQERVITFAHEFGHALGLGHSSVRESLMYYSISTKENALLTEDDWEGLSYLYPRNELAVGPFACGHSHSRGSPWSGLAVLIFLGGTLALGRCLRPARPLGPRDTPA